MYTECPSCNTLFKVSTAQLKTAAGKVRCGRCNTVFNALERLTDELPEGVTNLTQPASEMLTDSPKSSFDEVAIPGMDEGDFGAGVDESEDKFDFDLGAGLDDDASADLGLSDGGADAGGFSFDDELETPAEKKASDSFFDLPDEVADEPRDMAATELEPPEDSIFGGLDEDVRMPSGSDDDKASAQARKVDREKELEGISDDPLDAVQQDFIGDSDAADAYVLEELSSPSSRSFGWLKNLVWIVVIVLLLVVLVGQFVYFKRADLAQYPTIKPWLEKMCDVVSPYFSCEIPDPVDLAAIKIIDKDVRSHPNSKNALLITATINNEAEFDQPYPMLELRFSDINDKVIAKRQFAPAEYLDKSVDSTALMLAGVPVRMMLEIVDPGADAVNFKFEFLPSPEPAAEAVMAPDSAKQSGAEKKAAH